MLGVVDSPGAAGYRPAWRKEPVVSGGGVLMDMLHSVYLAEHLLGQPVHRVSGFVDAAPGDAVEALALGRFEAEGRAALVDVAWGEGEGGIAVSGTKGRAMLRFRDDGTPPWAPFDRLTVTTGSGARIVDKVPGAELAPLLADSLRSTISDAVAAIRDGHSPATTGDDARSRRPSPCTPRPLWVAASLYPWIPPIRCTPAAWSVSPTTTYQPTRPSADSPVGRLGLYGLNPSLFGAPT